MQRVPVKIVLDPGPARGKPAAAWIVRDRDGSDECGAMSQPEAAISSETSQVQNPLRRIQACDQSVPRDSGRIPGRGSRDAERSPGERGSARSSRRAGIRIRRSVLDSDRAEHGDDVQRRLCGVRECVVRAAQNPASGRRESSRGIGVLPFAPGYWPMLLLLVIAGLSSGTFYSLTMTFVLTALPKRLIIFGIAAYAADIVFVSNIASLLEGWYIDYLSWNWIFWTAAVATPVMMLCIYFGIPRRPSPGPTPSWRGFAYFSASLALIYGALDQGERLDWLELRRDRGDARGRTVPAYCHLRPTDHAAESDPESLVSQQQKHHHSALSIFVFKFVHLAALILVPGFLEIFNSTGRSKRDTRSPGSRCRCS